MIYDKKLDELRERYNGFEGMDEDEWETVGDELSSAWFEEFNHCCAKHGVTLGVRSVKKNGNTFGNLLFRDGSPNAYGRRFYGHFEFNYANDDPEVSALCLSAFQRVYESHSKPHTADINQ